MAESGEKFEVLQLEEFKHRERKLNESELHWKREIQLRQRYVADLRRKIDVSSSVEERKSLSVSIQYNEECIDSCRLAISSVEAKRKLLIMGKESEVLCTNCPPSGVASKACPTKNESTLIFDDAERLRQYDKSLEHGFIQLWTAECVIVGVASSGKTRSLAMALDHTVPTTRVNTPCSKAPAHTVTQTRVGVKDDHLCVIDDEAYLITVIQTAKHLAGSLPAHTPTPRSFVRTQDPSLSCMRKLKKKIVQCVLDNRASAYHLLHDQRWIKLTDNGGQPQFLEVLPLFVRHVSLGIFTVKLNKRLDSHPIYFDESGRKIGRSCYSHEQMIRFWLRTLISQDKGVKRMRFLFLGTHRDLQEQSVGESIQEKNAKLLKIVSSFKLQDSVIFSNQGCDNLIFAINARTPAPEDWEVIRHVRSVMVESSNVPPIQTPIKWFVVELALLHFVKETQQPILLESTCLDMMACFHIDQENLKAALKHLHQTRLIFYFEKRGLIVADMQVILDKLSELVHYSLHLQTRPHKQAALDGVWRKFCRYGILNSRCLEKFHRHYAEGVFTPEDLLDIFVQLHIVSELRPGEFLMPCLLPMEELTLDTAPPVPAMAVEFPNGGPILGTYWGLVCHLMSVDKWELATIENGEPCHLTRSSVDFSAPEKLPGRVTISDPLSSFFLVAYHGPLDVAKRVCPIIRETVIKRIEKTLETLNYSSQSEEGAGAYSSCHLLDVGSITITFLCSCETTPPHAAVLSKNGKYLKCPHNTQRFERVTAKHKMWLADDTMKLMKSPQRTTSSTTTVALTLNRLTLLKWHDEQGHTRTFRLADKVSAGWILFGTLLGLSSNQLDVMRQDNSGSATLCWRAVMEWWVRGGHGSLDEEYPITWEGLYQLLQDAEYSEVAGELERVVSRAVSSSADVVGICSDCEAHTSSPSKRRKSSCQYL